jgi:hypothetical protein
MGNGGRGSRFLVETGSVGNELVVEEEAAIFPLITTSEYPTV